MREGDYFHIAPKDSFFIKIQWDSVLRPKHKIIEVEKVDDIVILDNSKTDPRILILNKEHTIYREHFTFKNDQTKVEVINYLEALLYCSPILN